jgi:hypothetical protein
MFFINLFKLIAGLQELVWFILGGASSLAIAFSYMKLKKMEKFHKGAYTLLILSVLTFDFTILWTFESYIENEVRAANMGLLTFGLVTAVFAVIAFRLINRKPKTPQITDEEALDAE